MHACSGDDDACVQTALPCTVEDDEEAVEDEAPESDLVRRKSSVDHRVFKFVDSEKMKRQVRKRVKDKPTPYDVQNVYYDTGWCQAIARNHYFENLTLGVIIVNAVWIAIDTDWNDATTLLDAKVAFVVADCLFFAYFSLELAVRFGAFKYKRNCLKDAWFVFDTSLVTLYLFDPFVITLATALSSGDGLNLPTSLLRLFRLARLSRLARMLRSLPELMIMIKGMISAAASVSYMLGLLVLVTYIFAIAMTQLSLGTEFRETYFKGVALSMYTLFIYGTFLDSLNDFVDSVKEESSVCVALLAVFAVISALTLLNMLIGVLCEVVSAIAKTEREVMLTEKVRDKFGKIIGEIDKDGDGNISWDEVASMAEHPDAGATLASVNIDLGDMVEIAEDFIFAGGNQQRSLTFDQFMDMALDCRNTQTAVIRDVMVLRKRFNRKITDMKGAIQSVDSKLNTLIERSTMRPCPASEERKLQDKNWVQHSKDAHAEASDDAQTTLATTKIQATYRGIRARRQLDLLPESRPATSEDHPVLPVPSGKGRVVQALIRNDEAVTQVSAQEVAQRMLGPPSKPSELLAEEQSRLLESPQHSGLPGQMAMAEELH